MLVRAIKAESRAIPTTVAGWRQLLFDGVKTNAGRRVSANTAMMHSTVYTCVRFLSFNVAQLPLILYRRLSDDPGEPARERATDHPLYEKLHSLANARTTAFNAMSLLIASLMLRGNGLAFVQREESGRVMGLFPLRWDQIEIRRRASTGEIVYEWKPQEGPVQVFDASEVWHIQGLGVDGVQGLSPIALMRESIGHGLALQEYGSRFFSNSATPSGALEFPGELSETAYKRLKQGIEENRAGLENAHKVMLLEEGAKWNQIGISPEDAQFLETRKFNRAEVAGWYGIPPHLIGDLEKATFSNIEQQSLEFVIYFLMPWLVNIEQTITRDLILERERGTLFAKFNVAGLLRGDSAARSAAQRTGVMAGWLSRNEVRVQEDLNPRPGLDDPLVPLNVTTVTPEGEVTRMDMGVIPGAPSLRQRAIDRDLREHAERDADRWGDPPPARTERERRAVVNEQAEARAAIAARFGPLYRDAAARILRAEIRELKPAIELHLEERDASTFESHLDRFYAAGSDFSRLAERRLSPVADPLAAAMMDAVGREVEEEPDSGGFGVFVAAVVVAAAARHLISSRGQLKKAAASDPASPAKAALDLISKWQDSRPDRIARKETVHQSRAFARESYRRVGVTKLRWIARGENCPFCDRLNGRIVGVEQSFVQDGESFEGDPKLPPLVVKTSISHPPIHRGCDCEIGPA